MDETLGGVLEIILGGFFESIAVAVLEKSSWRDFVKNFRRDS